MGAMDPGYRYEIDHFDTDEGYPQTKEGVEAMGDDELEEFMGHCDKEPADFENCLACYAYKVAQDREEEDNRVFVRTAPPPAEGILSVWRDMHAARDWDKPITHEMVNKWATDLYKIVNLQMRDQQR